MLSFTYLFEIKTIDLNLEDVEKYGFQVDLDQVKRYSNNTKIYLNKKALIALKKAENELPNNYKFVIKYGYRSLEEQTEIVKQEEQRLKKTNPENWEELLNKYTGGYEELKLTKISFMNHRSGNAIDLTMVDKNGKELDLGSVKYNKTDRIDYYDNLKNLSKQDNIIKENRKILKDVMTKNGFIPYPLEWWHWGYSK